MTELLVDAAAELIHRALDEGRPELVFGSEPRSMRKLYRELARLVHPDRNGGTKESADAFIALESLWKVATALLDGGDYGRLRSVVTIKTKRRTLQVYGKVGSDDVADHLRAHWDGGTGTLRVARHPRDNDLVRSEARTLAAVRKRADVFLPFLPTLVETVAVRQSGGIVRHANLFSDDPGRWLSLETVRSRRGDVHALDVAWMWRRLLAVLGVAHEAGFVHGAVSVRNVLIEPDSHGLVVRNWSYAVPIGERRLAVERGVVYPPDVDGGVAAAAVDIFLAARTMVELCGSRSVPASWPTPVRAHFRACLLPTGRPSDAWRLLDDFDGMLERNFGPRRFRPFPVP